MRTGRPHANSPSHAAAWLDATRRSARRLVREG
jgi:hypothetical protein